MAGSDKRGAAYGILALSETMGVSPLYWWSDVPVQHREALFLSAGITVSKTPSVRYRGIFINDEDWGFTPWARKNFEKSLGDIGPKTYAKVCELLVRMKANMLAAAMHPCSGAFYTYPESKVVADSFGNLFTTSHCEPLLYDNASEWKVKTMSDWNYLNNRQGIIDQLCKRVEEAALYDNIYTLALRGIHDGKMKGISRDKKMSVVQQGIDDQRDILSKYLKKPPRIFR